MIRERAVVVKGAESFLRRRFLGATISPSQIHNATFLCSQRVIHVSEVTLATGARHSPDKGPWSTVVRHCGRSPVTTGFL
jgi:hypothetical protein